MRIAPNPKRQTGRSPPITNSPLFAAGKSLPDIPPPLVAAVLSLIVFPLAFRSSKCPRANCTPQALLSASIGYYVAHSFMNDACQGLNCWMHEPHERAYGSLSLARFRKRLQLYQRAL